MNDYPAGVIKLNLNKFVRLKLCFVYAFSSSEAKWIRVWDSLTV